MFGASINNDAYSSKPGDSALSTGIQLPVISALPSKLVILKRAYCAEESHPSNIAQTRFLALVHAVAKGRSE
jgi:hypothetical protein